MEELLNHIPNWLWVIMSLIVGGVGMQIKIWAVEGFKARSIFDIFTEFKDGIKISIDTLNKNVNENHEDSKKQFELICARLSIVETEIKSCESRIFKLENNSESTDFKRLECLLVEDDEGNRELVELMLREKHNVLSVGTYDEAIKMLRCKIFDFIVTDLQLDSNKTGIDIKKICLDKKYCIDENNNIKIIIYSGSSKDIDILSGLGTVTLKKPFKKEDLFKAINYIL